MLEEHFHCHTTGKKHQIIPNYQINLIRFKGGYTTTVNKLAIHSNQSHIHNSHAHLTTRTHPINNKARSAKSVACICITWPCHPRSNRTHQLIQIQTHTLQSCSINQSIQPSPTGVNNVGQTLPDNAFLHYGPVNPHDHTAEPCEQWNYIHDLTQTSIRYTDAINQAR